MSVRFIGGGGGGSGSVTVTSPESSITVTGSPGSSIGLDINPATTNVYIPAAMTTAAISAAANAAYAAGGGIVQLPPVTITLTGPLPVLAGVQYNGSGFGSYGALGNFTGTILYGNQTFDCFDYNATDAGSQPYANLAAQEAAMVSGFGISNLTISNFVYGIKIGSLWNAGASGPRFTNLAICQCTAWGMWLENTQLEVCSNLSISKNGNNLMLRSSNPFLNCGNATFTWVTASYLTPSGTSPFGRGITVQSVNSSSMNDVAFFHIDSDTGVTPITQAATMSNASANITITDGTKYQIGLPVTFSANANGFIAGTLYFILTLSGNVVTLGNTTYGTAITPTGSTAVNMITAGFAGFSVEGDGTIASTAINVTGMDLEGYASAKVLFQDCHVSKINGDYITQNTGYPTVCIRTSQSLTIALNNTYSVDCDASSPVIHAGAAARSDLFTTQGATYSVGIGIQPLGSGTYNAISYVGGAALSLFGKAIPDLVANSGGAGTLALIRGLQLPPNQLTGTQTLQTNNLYVHTGATNDTWTLPTLTQYWAGFFTYVVNPQAANTLTVQGGASQNIVGLGVAAANSISIAANSNALLVACANGSTYFWARLA